MDLMIYLFKCVCVCLVQYGRTDHSVLLNFLKAKGIWLDVGAGRAAATGAEAWWNNRTADKNCGV